MTSQEYDASHHILGVNFATYQRKPKESLKMFDGILANQWQDAMIDYQNITVVTANQGYSPEFTHALFYHAAILGEKGAYHPVVAYIEREVPSQYAFNVFAPMKSFKDLGFDASFEKDVVLKESLSDLLYKYKRIKGAIESEMDPMVDRGILDGLFLFSLGVGEEGYADVFERVVLRLPKIKQTSP